MTRVARASRPAFLVFLLFASCAERPTTTHDDLGRAVTLPREITRVVCLAPNLTEIVYAVGGGAHLVATDDFSNYPAAARKLPKVGGMQPNVEKIAALKPDLVLASTEGNHPNVAQALEAAGIPLFVVRTDRLAEIEPAMRRLGEMLHGAEKNRAPKHLRSDLMRQSRKRERAKRILFMVWTDPLYVAGRNTFTDDLLRLTGAQNAVQVTGWPQYSLESLAASPPELILYPRGAVTPQQVDVLMKRVPSLKAEVIAVDEDIFQRPGPRVVQAAAALNAILDARDR